MCAHLAGQDIPDDIIMSIAAHENFLGVKECTGELALCVPWNFALPCCVMLPYYASTGNLRIEDYHSKGVVCWSGNDDEAHAARHCHQAQVGQ
jgi:4-hydroxy-tetrahydrodipicolinate synthase